MKSALKSKTIGTAALVAVLSFLPDVQQIICDHPEGTAKGLAVIFTVLRLYTKESVRIKRE